MLSPRNHKRPFVADECLDSSAKRLRLGSESWSAEIEARHADRDDNLADSGSHSDSEPLSTASTGHQKQTLRGMKSSTPVTLDSSESESDFSSSSASSSDSDSESDGTESVSEGQDLDQERRHIELGHVGSEDSTNVANDSLRERLASFIPSLRAANEELEREIEAGKAMGLEIDSDEEEQGQYIEMNLGLGVLQERNDTDQSSSESESSASSDSSQSSGRASKQEKNLVAKLMGDQAKKKPRIEEMTS